AHSQTMSLAATAPAGTLSSSASAPVFSSSEAGSSAKLRTSKKVGRKGDSCLATGTEHWQATSWSHGQIPGWAPKRYELLKAEEEKAIGVPRGKSDYKKRQEGDHTQGVHCAKPHFHSDYMSLGQDPRFTGKRTALGLAVELADAGVDKADIKDKVREGDLTRGIRGKEGWFKTTYSDLGEVHEVQNWTEKEHGRAPKYMYS
ncbi:unnamed protein product, partial [Polarella glacialis]